jgi:uridylate kinase
MQNDDRGGGWRGHVLLHGGFLNAEACIKNGKGVVTVRIVLRIGGSVVASPVNPELISEYADMMKAIRTQGHRVVVVVGGGALAREFIGVARSLGLKQEAQDGIAISVSRIFAQLLLKRIGNLGCEDVSLSVEEAVQCARKGKVAVMAGLKPGMTTDAVAAMVAEAFEADLLVKATDQEGIFDKDPKKHADAVKLDHLKFEDLTRVCVEDRHKAGIHQVIDPEAIKILQRTRVKVVVINGFKPKNVLTAVEGKRVGTLVD